MLDRTLALGLVGLFVVAITLPALLAQRAGPAGGRPRGLRARPSSTGARRCSTPPRTAASTAPSATAAWTAEGGVAPFTITDANGQFVKQVDWRAPGPQHRAAPLRPGGGALHPHLRPHLLADAGLGRQGRWPAQRPAAPEPDRLHRVDPDHSRRRPQAAGPPTPWPRRWRRPRRPASPYASEGEALFNLGYYTGFAGGAYACGRCHTTGWSYGEKGSDGNGALGPSLRDGVSTTVPGRCAGFTQQVDFVCAGSERGVNYGQQLAGHGPHARLLPGAGRAAELARDRRGRRRGPRALRPRHRRRHVLEGGRREDRPLREGPVTRGLHARRHHLGPGVPGLPHGRARHASILGGSVWLILSHQQRVAPRLPARSPAWPAG